MLKLSKKGSYGMKAMIYIAKDSGQVHISDIAESEGISLSLLRRIISDLEKAELLETQQGRHGGIRLRRDKSKISVYDILSAVWEELGITDCTKWDKCENIDCCTTTDFLNTLQGGFHSLLKIYTLDKIMK